MPTTASEMRHAKPGLEPSPEMNGFANRMAHDIRNPLNAIRMQVAVIRNKLSRPCPENLEVAKDQLGKLDSEVLRIEKLVKMFLEFGHSANPSLEEVRLVEFIEKD